MNESRVLCHLALECFPDRRHWNFREYAAASASYFFVPTLWDQGSLESHLKEDGWISCRVLSERLVKVEDYHGREEEALIREAEDAGLSCTIFRVRREVITTGDDDMSRIEEVLSHFDGRVFTLVGGDQYANGVSPAGGDFVPFWGRETDVHPWLDFWPDHSVEELSDKAEIREVLELVDSEQMMCGVGGERSLYTFHPKQLSLHLGFELKGRQP